MTKLQQAASRQQSIKGKTRRAKQGVGGCAESAKANRCCLQGVVGEPSKINIYDFT
jgi:hypothetical protein